jgi:hypothetical protein
MSAIGAEVGSAPAPEPRRGFESLIAGELGAGAIFVALLLAAFWGAAHALTPGHGKAIVAGYLVGTRGRPRDAVALGLIVTATHTIGVFALGIVTLSLSAFVVPEQLYPWLTLSSGLLVVGVGTSVLWRRLRTGGSTPRPSPPPPPPRARLRTGRPARGRHRRRPAPCPSALVVLLSAIALHRVGLGLVLILAFSAGLAATITAIGLIAVLARRAFSRLRLDGRLIRALRRERARDCGRRGGHYPQSAAGGVLDVRTRRPHGLILGRSRSLDRAARRDPARPPRHRPDHLAAVTTLVAGAREAARTAAGLGFAWGAGHALTLFAFGLRSCSWTSTCPSAYSRPPRPRSPS